MKSGSVLGIALAAFVVLAGTVARAEQGSFAEEQRGKYLAAVGDCQACHTAEGGKPYAGGRPVSTPFGVIYSPNITPDRETGIGTWTDEQFYRAMHGGIAADGDHLYPAFPYPWFTKASRADVDAIRAYLKDIPPVSQRRPKNTLPWPIDERIAMTAWNKLFFAPGTYKGDPHKSDTWNRGAYLVEGLGHCGACHTPTNLLGASKASAQYRGGNLDNWYAPDIASDLRQGLANWSVDDIVSFLKTGRNATDIAYGPMAEVVRNSTSQMTDDDLKAVAIYLKSLPAKGGNETASRPGGAVIKSGGAIYADSCSECHRADGTGVAQMFPSLKSSAMVQSTDATSIIRLILNGGRGATTAAAPTQVSMPSFGWKLSDAQVAAVATYIRNDWGNHAAPVSAGDVHSVRQAVRTAASDN